MTTYECSKCGMSVNATCVKCNEPLINDNLKLDEVRGRQGNLFETYMWYVENQFTAV